MDLAETRETYRNTLIYAIGIAGSEQALAVRLYVTLPQLRNWLDGIDGVPLKVFLDAVDIVVNATPTEMTRSREALTRQLGRSGVPPSSLTPP